MTTAYGPIGSPRGGEQRLHVPLVHGGRGGEHARADVAHAGELEQALQGAVLAVRAVQQRQDDVDVAELARHLAGLEHDHARAGRVAREQRPSCPSHRPTGSVPPVIASFSGSSAASTQRPSREMPIGTTS